MWSFSHAPLSPPPAAATPLSRGEGAAEVEKMKRRRKKQRKSRPGRVNAEIQGDLYFREIEEDKRCAHYPAAPCREIEEDKRGCSIGGYLVTRCGGGKSRFLF